MAGPFPRATRAYAGAAVAADANHNINGQLQLNPSHSSPHASSTNLQYFDPDLNADIVFEHWELKVDDPSFTCSLDQVLSETPSSHGSDAPSMSSLPSGAGLQPPSLSLQSGAGLPPSLPSTPLPALCNNLLSTEPRQALSSYFATSVLPESSVYNLQPQVYERQPSLTCFAHPPPPSSKVVEMQCLPDSSDYNTIMAQNIWSYQFNANIAFRRPSPSEVRAPFLENVIRVEQASDMQLLAFTLDRRNDANADTFNFGAQGTHLMANPQYAEPHKFTPLNAYKKALSDSAAIYFSSASASSLSYKANCTLDFKHMNFQSTPVSPSPSVNKEAPHESFQNVEDASSVHGENHYASSSKTAFYMRHDKSAWRKQGSMVGGCGKKRRYSRKTGRPSGSQSSPCLNINGNANSAYNHPQENNSTHEESRVLIKLKTPELNFPDGYDWRKYGEKEIKDEKYSRDEDDDKEDNDKEGQVGTSRHPGHDDNDDDDQDQPGTGSSSRGAANEQPQPPVP
ncbi:hypothetical protein L7F22_053553 [Adiantum nelumboides]|nr:hypothetical protein [Adiantum nelumboides]